MKRNFGIMRNLTNKFRKNKEQLEKYKENNDNDISIEESNIKTK